MRTFIALSIALALAAPAVARADGGKIAGTISATPAKYLADTVVFIKAAPGSFTPKTVAVDQRGMKFIPRLSVAVAGDTVEFMNHDTVAHNVMSPDHGAYDLGNMKVGESRKKKFDAPGVWVQLCSIHPEMLAYVFVGQNPYLAVVDASGAFTIAGVPPGDYVLSVWNPKLKAADAKITVTAGGTTQAHFDIAR